MVYLKLLQQKINILCWIEKELSCLLNPGFYNTEFLLHLLSVSQLLNSMGPLGPGLCEEAEGKDNTCPKKRLKKDSFFLKGGGVTKNDQIGIVPFYLPSTFPFYLAHI